jgi:adenosine deaminase
MADLDRLRATSKAELHLHLDGSVRPSTVEELARELELVPADAPPGAAMDRVRVTRRAGLLQALKGFAILLPILQTRAHLQRVAGELVEDLAADGVTYAELRFCPRLNTEAGLSMEEVLDAVAEAAAETGERTGTRTALIACLMGGYPAAWNETVVDAAIRAQEQGVVAVDLAGTVEDRDDIWIDEHSRLFGRAREAGLRVTIHAGEADGPESIRTALDRYFAERIGHGTALEDDPDLLAEVIERGIPLESCPGSNYWTRTHAQMPDLAAHPVGEFLRSGANVCVNTDDRSLFANTLSGELQGLADAQALTDEEIDTLIRNGFDGAFA